MKQTESVTSVQGGNQPRSRDGMGEEVLYAGDFLRVLRQGHWEFVERANCRDAVCVVAVTPERELLLVEQYRIPVGEPVIELPAGLVGDQDPGEDYAAAALRELEEETGYSARHMRLLFEGPPSAGLATERIAFYRAEGLVRTGQGGGDNTEEITVHVVPLAGIEAWLRTRAEKVAVDPKIYAGLFALRGDM